LGKAKDFETANRGKRSFRGGGDFFGSNNPKSEKGKKGREAIVGSQSGNRGLRNTGVENVTILWGGTPESNTPKKK